MTLDPHCRVWVKAIARLSCVNSGEVHWASDEYPVRLRWADDGRGVVTDRGLDLKVTLGGWSGKIGLYVKGKPLVTIALDDFLHPVLSGANVVTIPKELFHVIT